MEKIFCEMQGKHSYSVARRHGMTRSSVNLTLTVDKWYMGWGEISLGWPGCGEESICGKFTPFPLFCCPQKFINGNCERGCEVKSI